MFKWGIHFIIIRVIKLVFFFFETGSHYVTQAGLELRILLP
jgi:hypothetical protein